jgi:hypothetical protein
MAGNGLHKSDASETSQMPDEIVFATSSNVSSGKLNIRTELGFSAFMR